MSAQLNKVFIIGNLTRDPDYKELQSGSSVCSFSVAVNRSYATKDGEKKEEVSFIKVQAWGKLAETCGKYLTKGSQLLVDGALKQERWETEDGTKKDKTLVSAVAVQFLNTKPRAEAEQQAPEEEVESIDVDVDVNDDEPAPF